jgi:presenilin-like A22 family membrane protease
MKYSISTIALIMSLFLIGTIFGLYVNNQYITKELPYGLEPPQIEQNNSPWYIMGAVLFATGLILLARRFKFEMLMRVWFYFAFTICVAVTLSVFVDGWIAFIVAGLLVLLKFKEADLFVHNLVELLLYGGLVALFAPIFNIWGAVAVLVLISVYDFISVFITKHMITLAQFQEKLGIFAGLMVVNKHEVAILGGGDIAFTLLFATVVLRNYGWFNALFVIYGAAIAITILMIIGEKKKYYPAMPFVTIGSVLGFLITII